MHQLWRKQDGEDVCSDSESDNHRPFDSAY